MPVTAVITLWPAIVSRSSPQVSGGVSRRKSSGSYDGELAEAAGDWFHEIVATLFGALADGNRLVREVFCLVPKKNSKTTNSAALMHCRAASFSGPLL